MMNKKTSYKRIVSLVLAVFMVASLLSVSAAADNKIIKINGEVAVNGNEYESGAVVTIDTDDTVTVEVNGKEVTLDDKKSFTLSTAETTDTADTAETNDEATPDNANVPVEAGKVIIVVYVNGTPVANVAVILKPKSTEKDDATPGNATPGNATPGNATPGNATPGNATPDDSTPGNATPGNATPGNATPDDATPDDATPDDATPDDATPDDATPDDATPDTAKKVKVLNGDVDGDGKITSNDALLILRYSIGLEKFTKLQEVQGDVDGDGKNYSADALTVLRASLGLETITPEYIEVEI